MSFLFDVTSMCIGATSSIRLVDLCIAALSKCILIASDVKLLQLPKSLAKKIYTNILYLTTMSD